MLPAPPMRLHRRQWLALTAGLWLAPGKATVREHRVLFGGPVDLLLSERAPRRSVAAVLRGLEAMNQRWNAWKPGDVTAVNQAFAAGRAVQPTREVLGLIQGAAALERLSGGFFNAGIGGLVATWGFHADTLQPGTAPRRRDIELWSKAQPSLTQIEQHRGWVRSRNPRLQLDFGGYAKGVALDWALDRLQLGGVESAVLNLGGNLAAMAGPGQRPWQIGVQDPLGPGLMARIATQGREAVVTSGTYERYRTLDGIRRSHVMDPALGRPVDDLVSVTVVHPSASLADAAATALLVAGSARWQALAQRMGVDQVLVVDRHGRRVVTAALERRVVWQT
jgi:thiamine biosynthesis lipoprotein